MNFKTDDKKAIKILAHYIGIGFILFFIGIVALSFFTAYLRYGKVKVERSLKLMSYDFPKIDDGDVNFLRKFVLLFKVINRIIEKSFRSSEFTFSWEEILSNLLHLDNDPNLMIKSMIRELKRRKSYSACMINKKENKIYSDGSSLIPTNYKQKKIIDFII